MGGVGLCEPQAVVVLNGEGADRRGHSRQRLPASPSAALAPRHKLELVRCYFLVTLPWFSVGLADDNVARSRQGESGKPWFSCLG